MTQVQVEEFIKHEATCYVMARKAGLSTQLARHLFKLSEFSKTHVVDITYAIGFANGWMEATAHYAGVPVRIQAIAAHELMCLEKA